MKTFSSLLIAGFLALGSSQAVGQICNISSNMIPCTGFLLGQEEAGTLGAFSGTEEWLAIGKSLFPSNNGDIAYGARLQRHQNLSIYQLGQRTGSASTFDTQIGFGYVYLDPEARRPQLPRLDFEFIFDDRTAGPSVVTELNIATLVASNSKVITPGGISLACIGPAPCFGRMGIENTAPTYTLDVNGIGRVTALIVSSDARFKKDIATIENGRDVIAKLRPTTYQFNTETKLAGHDFDEGLQSGFIAQELEQVLPHTVYTDEQGYKAVNYIAVIPYLVSAVKELDVENKSLQADNAQIIAQNAALQAQLDALLKGDHKGQGASQLNGSSIPAELFQNVPNPFDKATEIGFSLPASVQAASLLVFDMNGKQLRSYNIAERGLGSVRIAASELESGMYLYTLLADGKEVGTRRMIITQ